MKRLMSILLLGPGLAAAATIGAFTWDLYSGTAAVKEGGKALKFQSLEECAAKVDAIGKARLCKASVKVAPAAASAPASAPAPAPAPAVWVECARETGTCSFTGSKLVKYGGKLAGQQSIIKTLTGPVACVDATFGAAHSTYENFCFIGGAGEEASTAPAPVTPAPATTQAGLGPRVSTFTPSGPIAATSGQVIAGVSISNPGGNCITIPAGVTGVVVRDSKIGPCGGDASIVVQGNNATIEFTEVRQGKRGVLINRASGATLRASVIAGPFAGNSCGTSNPDHCSGAVQLDNANGATIDGNLITGEAFGSDALSGYESSGLRFTNNVIDVGIAWQHAAPFTMGDSTTGNPGRDNYVAGNVVRQRGGVPPGVFGAGGNTVFERNCLTTGIQAYNYSGIFTGVTVRNNVIGPGSYVPDPSLLAGWSTNVFGADCSKVPQ